MCRAKLLTPPSKFKGWMSFVPDSWMLLHHWHNQPGHTCLDGTESLTAHVLHSPSLHSTEGTGEQPCHGVGKSDFIT